MMEQVWILRGINHGDITGVSVSSAGDLNYDGYSDIIIGSPLNDGLYNNQSDSGRSYIVFGGLSNFGVVSELGKMTTGNVGFSIFGKNSGDISSFSVAAAGDVNGDGYGDILLGEYGADIADAATSESGGECYVVFGSPVGVSPDIDLSALAVQKRGLILRADTRTDRAGFSVSSAGDVNGDGLADMVVGAGFADGRDDTKARAGDTYLVFGGTTSVDGIIELSKIGQDDHGAIIHGEDVEDYAGFSVAAAGDFDGDGLADLVIGAPGGDGLLEQSAWSGDTYVIFGRSTGFGSDIDLHAVARGEGGFVIRGSTDIEEAGGAVATAGDFNGDGFADLIIGATGGHATDGTGVGAGNTYVVFGRQERPMSANTLAGIVEAGDGIQVHGQSAGDRSGWSVASAGDLNADGYDDVVIGAPYFSGDSGVLKSAGAAYVIFGSSGGFGSTIELSAVARGIGGFMIMGQGAGDSLGTSVASAGDINGDGFDDLVMGAPNGNSGYDTMATAGAGYVVLGRDFLGTVSHLGSPLNDRLVGSSEPDIMVGGVGDDILSGAGGADVLVGGAGNDVIHVSSVDFRRADGGSGTDTLALDGAGLTLNLGAMSTSRLRNIERIDLTGSGDNNLDLTALAVLNLSVSSNALTVFGDFGDTVSFGSEFWAKGATSDGFTLYKNGQANVQIANALITPTNPTSLSIAALNTAKLEGTGGTNPFTFTVTRGGTNTGATTADWVVTGSGKHPADARDFVGSALPMGIVTFAAGEISQTINIEVVGDTMPEADEEFTVTLSEASFGATLGTATAAGTIQADDAIDDLAVVNSTTGLPVATPPVFYTGTVAGLDKELILVTPDNLNISVAGPNWFIQTGSGTDAIAAFGGTNVLDGGAGSNFLTAGPGADTFFVDARGATAPIWSTVVGFGPGDAATMWGISQAGFTLDTADGEGAPGFTGWTIHATAPGQPTASLTLAGYTQADFVNPGAKLLLLFGNDPGSGSDYTYIQAV